LGFYFVATLQTAEAFVLLVTIFCPASAQLENDVVFLDKSAGAKAQKAKNSLRGPKGPLFHRYTIKRYTNQKRLFQNKDSKELALPPMVSISSFVSSEMIPSTPMAAALRILRGSLTVQVITVLPAACNSSINVGVSNP
jgi:hypothetical protein